MTVRLPCCSNVWVKISSHPCWKVQKALDEAGIGYEIVKGPLRPAKRDDVERLSGQRKYPVIEFEDGQSLTARSRGAWRRRRRRAAGVEAGAGGAAARRLTHAPTSSDAPIRRARPSAPWRLAPRCFPVSPAGEASRHGDGHR